MAFREHNANILPPIYTNDKTWSTPQTLHFKSSKESVPVDASKESFNLIPAIQRNSTVPIVSASNIHQTFKAKINKANIGTMKADTTQAEEKGTLISRLFYGGSSGNDPDSFDSFRMESLRSTIGTIATPLETKVGHERRLSSWGKPSPGFNNYADAVKSNIVGESSNKKTIPYFKIFEDNCNGKQVDEAEHYSTSLTIQQYSQKLHSLSENGERKSAQEAEAVLRDMIHKYENGFHKVRPDGGCFNRYVRIHEAVTT